MHVKEKMIFGDFHLHTTYSPDGSISIKDLISRVSTSSLNCIAVTDHDTIEGARALIDSNPPFRVIIGEEISTTEGHVIGLFLNECIPPGLSVPETIDRIKQQGGVAIAPHPFARIADDSLQEAFVRHWSLFDAVEVYNSNNFIKADDKKAMDFAVAHQLPVIGGSDTHLPQGIGKNVVSMSDFSSPEEFLGALTHAHIEHKKHSFTYFLRMAKYDVLHRYRGLKRKFTLYGKSQPLCHTPSH